MSARATGGPKSVELEALLRDLGDETGYLMGLLLALPTPAWDTPTPAEGWTVRDQVSHLAFSDNAAHHAITDERRFEQLRAEALLDLAEFIERANIPGRRLPGNELLGQFLRARMELIESLRSVAPQVRIPWFGPAMSVASFATARLMETWAHGQDIIDALGLSPVATDRLRHIADLGVRTLPNSFRVRGRPVPTAPVRVELTGPHERGIWSWGAPEATNHVTGPALDFCLVVTQRRHLLDTRLAVVGDVATEWMAVAQAFAGPPGEGRRPGQFPVGNG